MPAAVWKFLILILAFLTGFFGVWLYWNHYQQKAMLHHEFADKLVVLDPGHVGSEIGVIGSAGAKEKEITLILAKKLDKLLRQDGVKTMLTRVNNNELSAPKAGKEYDGLNPGLSRRVALANNNNADIFVSIHINSYHDPRIGGAQVFYHADSVKGKRLAASIQQEFDKDLVNPGRVIMPEDFFVLRMTKMPSVLAEVGFLTNPKEEQLLMSDAYQNKVALAIYNGIIRYLADEE